VERIKGMIAWFGFLSLALCVKSIYSGEHATLLGLILVFSIVAGQTILPSNWKLHKLKGTKI